MKDNITKDLLLCPNCDLAIKPQPVKPGNVLICPRCATPILAPVNNSIEKTLALSLTGLILFIPAIFMPLLTFDVIGLESSGSIFDSAIALLSSGFYFTGLAVLLTSIIIPITKLSILFVVSFQLYVNSATKITALLFRFYKHIDEWGMLEVYMIGILVTIIKMLHLAKIHYDIGFFCFIALLIATISSSLFLDSNHFWEKIHEQRTKGRKLQS